MPPLKRLPGPSVDFQRLWLNLKSVAEAAGQDRLAAVLTNHERNPEYILRRLGVVSDADVGRIAASLKPRK